MTVVNCESNKRHITGLFGSIHVFQNYMLIVLDAGILCGRSSGDLEHTVCSITADLHAFNNQYRSF